jgi:DNA invertase Pin-like site-specific DNA recombinase
MPARSNLRAVIYCRISLDRSGKGLGVEQQERDCRALADRLGLAVREVYVDNDVSASGYSRKTRPEYQRMLHDLEASPAVILAMHPDRMYRQMTELEALVKVVERLGITIHTVHGGDVDLSTASGRTTARLVGVIAQGESERMSERRKARKQAQRLAGEYHGGPRPFGFEKDGVTVRLDEAERIRQAVLDLLAGRTLYSLTREWNEVGVRPSGAPFGPLQPHPWTARQLSRVLVRARNAALIEHDGEMIGNAVWPAIISEDELRAVRAVLRNPARRISPGPARKHLLSGYLRCGVCGAPMVVSYSGGERARAVYRCVPGHGPGHASRTVHLLDGYITYLVIGHLSRPGNEIPAPAADTTLARTRLAAISAELDDLAELVGQQKISARQMAIASAPLEAEAEKLRERIDASLMVDALGAFRGAEDPAGVWEGLDLDRRRKVIERLVASITVNPAPKGRPKGWEPGQPYFDAESIEVAWLDL